MLFRTTGILSLSLSLGAMALGASAAAQTTPTPPAITRTVIAATKLSTVTDVPLYFKAVSVTLPSGEKSSLGARQGNYANRHTFAQHRNTEHGAETTQSLRFGKSVIGICLNVGNVNRDPFQQRPPNT